MLLVRGRSGATVTVDGTCDAPPARVAVAHDIAAFAARAAWEDLSDAAKEALKQRVLDSLGCAFGARGCEPMAAVANLIDELGGRPLCTLVGGGRTAPDRATFHNGALVRYLDFNDAYLAPGESCHPSDNLGAVLAAAEHARESGRTFLAALAVAYQVQCRLSDGAPVRDRGFDHTTHLALSAAAGASRALALDIERAAHAIAIATAGSPTLRVTRTGALSHWKGLAAPQAATLGVRAALLARRGITGPPEAFEGSGGFMASVSGPFSIDWSSEKLERVTRTSLKRYDAEIHAQSAVEALLDLLLQHGVDARRILGIEADVFDVAYRIIGHREGGETIVRTKEQADHSLPYMLAAAALDGDLAPEQYASERIVRDDVQQLLRRVVVRPAADLSARFPAEHPCRVRVVLDDGRVLAMEKHDYRGQVAHPMTWAEVRAKFARLCSGRLTPAEQVGVINAVEDLEDLDLAALCDRIGNLPSAETREAGAALGR